MNFRNCSGTIHTTKFGGMGVHTPGITGIKAGTTEGILTMSLLDKFRIEKLHSRLARIHCSIDYQQSLADRSEEAVAVIGLDGKMRFANQSWVTMHGYENKEELIGKHIKRFYDTKVMDNINRCIAQTRLLGWYITTLKQQRKDGTFFSGQMKMVAMKDDAAKPNAILMMLADVSRVGNIQEMIERTNKELEVMKVRVKRLEEGLCRCKGTIECESEEQAHPHRSQRMQLLPIAELKHLAQMAKRLS